MSSLYRVSYFWDDSYYNHYIVAENEDQVISNYHESIKINLEIIQSNILVYFCLMSFHPANIHIISFI